MIGFLSWPGIPGTECSVSLPVFAVYNFVHFSAGGAFPGRNPPRSGFRKRPRPASRRPLGGPEPVPGVPGPGLPSGPSTGREELAPSGPPAALPGNAPSRKRPTARPLPGKFDPLRGRSVPLPRESGSSPTFQAERIVDRRLSVLPGAGFPSRSVPALHVLCSSFRSTKRRRSRL